MNPEEILENTYQAACLHRNSPFFADPDIGRRIEIISRNIHNRAGTRVILACALAKLAEPDIDIRKPYTEIGAADAFSERTYDERYISPFITKHELPCNPTTAFLTPALRNRNTTLTPEVNLSGRPKEVYQALLELLTDVHRGRISAEQLLAETLRQLIVFRDEKRQRMDSLLAGLKSTPMDILLSAETIVTIIEQHLACKGSSRLPVLIVVAAYQAAQEYLQESLLPLEAHNAADSQTCALGDIQITLMDGENIITCYEMKMKRVTVGDIDLAVQEKLAKTTHPIDNYIFITTDIITPEAQEYAKSMYDKIGIEIVILDCIGFLRHFLHLFHRLRGQFLEAYQQLVLNEPESAVTQPLKEVFLTLRQSAESSG